MEKVIEEAPLTSYVEGDVGKWELDIKTIVEDIERIFGGYRFELVDGKVKKIRDESQAVLNEKGLRYLISRVISILHQGTALSDLSEDMIRKFVLFKSDAMRMEMRSKWKEFGLKRYYFETTVLDLAFLMYAWLMRAHKGGERTYRRGIERRVIEQVERAKKGILETVTGLFRRE
ncbi:MAG: hypothetical protein QW228_05995 [Candidatus Aenigmatarchaeota archaeon]